MRSTRSPSGSQRLPGWAAVSPEAADSPREIWWTESRNNSFIIVSFSQIPNKNHLSITLSSLLLEMTERQYIPTY